MGSPCPRLARCRASRGGCAWSHAPRELPFVPGADRGVGWSAAAFSAAAQLTSGRSRPWGFSSSPPVRFSVQGVPNRPGPSGFTPRRHLRFRSLRPAASPLQDQGYGNLLSQKVPCSGIGSWKRTTPRRQPPFHPEASVDLETSLRKGECIQAHTRTNRNSILIMHLTKVVLWIALLPRVTGWSKTFRLLAN